MFNDLLSNLTRVSNQVSRSISAENFNGEKGKAGMATEGVGKELARDLGIGWKISPYIVIAPHTTVELANIEGPGIIKHIWLTGPGYGRFLILRIYWEDNEYPSVECPLGDFFCDSMISKSTRVATIPVCRNPGTGMNCFWQMPFRKKCRITLESIDSAETCLYYQIDYTLTEIPDDCAYFHAQFRRTRTIPYMSDYTIIDGIKGKGQYVGTYMTWLPKSNTKFNWWGEGEIKFFLDGDTDFPTICGTGTEDYFLGSYNFGSNGHPTDFTSPYSGMNHFVPDDAENSMGSKIFCMYRFHVLDPIYFNSDLRITFQDLGWRCDGRYMPLEDDISSVAYWYQTMPFEKFPPCLSKDDLEF